MSHQQMMMMGDQRMDGMNPTGVDVDGQFRREMEQTANDFDGLFAGKSAAKASMAQQAIQRDAHPSYPDTMNTMGEGFPHVDATTGALYTPPSYGQSQYMNEDYYGPTSTALDADAKRPKGRFFQKSMAGTMAARSRWLDWSEMQRVENQRKKEEFQRKQEEMAKRQLPAPVQKARKESVRFMNDAQAALVENDSRSPLLQKFTMNTPPPPPPPPKKPLFSLPGAGRKKVKDTYTTEQWEKLRDFWGHVIFRKMRKVGIAVAILSMLVSILPMVNAHWITFTFYKHVNLTMNVTERAAYREAGYPISRVCSSVMDNGTEFDCEHSAKVTHHVEVQGLWHNCSKEYSEKSEKGWGDEQCNSLSSDVEDKWQPSMIGVLGCTLVLGFMGTVLSICGLCMVNLTQKVYYYHSAAEIFLVCSILSGAILVAFPTIIKTADPPIEHKLGMGYYLGWTIPGCFYMASLCMMIDDMVHYLAKKCCGKKKDKSAREANV